MKCQRHPDQLAALGQELLDKGNPGDAMAYFWHAANTYAAQGEWIRSGESLEKSADCLEMDGRYDMAVHDYLAAATAFGKAGDLARARAMKNSAEALTPQRMNRVRHVIGAVGRVSSGKDVLISRLSSAYGLPVVSMGDIARELAEKENLGAPSRDVLHTISQKYIGQFGPDYFPRRVIERIMESRWENACITGIRTPEDVRTFRHHFGDRFILVHVVVTDDSVRFERAKMRGSARDPVTAEALKAQDLGEEKLFRLSETCQLADAKMTNDGSLDEFFAKVDAFAAELGLSRVSVGS